MDIAWEPLSLPDHAKSAGTAAAPALVAFWRRVDAVLRKALPDYDRRTERLAQVPPDIREILEADLSVAGLQRLHALVTRDQAAVPAQLKDGTWRPVALAHGKFKQAPNSARRTDGRVRNFAPPELVQTELTTLLRLYATLSPEQFDVRAAFLMSGFLLTHPFADGNGRVARRLGDADAMRQGLPVVRPSLDVRAPGYIAAVQAMPDDFRPLARLVYDESLGMVLSTLSALELPAESDDWAHVASERTLVRGLRARFAESRDALWTRSNDWREAAMRRVRKLAEETDEAFELSLQIGTLDWAARDRVTASGVRVPRASQGIAARVTTRAADVDATVDIAPLGALGIDAAVVCLSLGRGPAREWRTPMLLVADEPLEAQVERLEETIDELVCALALRSVLFEP